MSSRSNHNDPLVDLDRWSYDAHFLPLPFQDPSRIVSEVEAYIASVNLAEHPFFELASVSKDALRLWMSQELVMTNAFSQIVLAAASRTENVHVRSVLAEVAYGEHGRCKQGLAAKSHPWLLHQMGKSVGLDLANVSPLTATRELIGQLETKSASDSLAAVAWIGVGNERLIQPEYDAIEKCFASVMADADYKPFLMANVTEDVLHSRLCFDAAAMLIGSCESEASRYLSEAKASVDARYDYFTELLDESLAADLDERGLGLTS